MQWVWCASRRCTLKVLWVSDAGVSSGFGKVTHAVCNHLHSQGWDCHILALNYFGNVGLPVDDNCKNFTLYNCQAPWDFGHDPFGASRLPVLVDRIRPDVIVLLNDCWNIQHYVNALRSYYSNPERAYLSHRWVGRQMGGSPVDISSVEWVVYCDDCGIENMGDPREMGDNPHYPHCCISTPVIAWLAVDSKNQHADILNNPLITHVVTWTEFGSRELVAGGYKGLQPTIIPLGVDPTIFYPRDKIESRIRTFTHNGLDLPTDAFVIGYVGRNQYRKRVDLLIQYFAEWIKRYNITNAYLFLHIGPTGDTGVDISSLVRYYGLGANNGVTCDVSNARVIVSSPEIGHGMSESDMPYVYSSFDVYVTCSQAEGWNLPALEAMACGVSCVLPDQGATGVDGGWCKNAALHIDCPTTAMTAPTNSYMHTIGGVPDKDSFIDALTALYTSKRTRDIMSNAGIGLSSCFTWDRTAKEFETMLHRVLGVPSVENIFEFDLDRVETLSLG